MTEPHEPGDMVEREEILVRRIAAVLDHPSLYMGGPSRQSLMTARRILPIIEAETAALAASGADRMREALERIASKSDGSTCSVTVEDYLSYWRAYALSCRDIARQALGEQP